MSTGRSSARYGNRCSGSDDEIEPLGRVGYDGSVMALDAAPPTSLVRALSILLPLLADGATVGTERLLASHGWQVADRARRTWSSGGLVGQLFPGAGRDGSDHFEISLVAAPGDVDDAPAEERLHEEFSARFDDGFEYVGRFLGRPDLVGVVGQDGFPEEVDAVMIATWPVGAGGFFLAYTHEDSGLPFRIVAIVDVFERSDRQPRSPSVGGPFPFGADAGLEGHGQGRCGPGPQGRAVAELVGGDGELEAGQTDECLLDRHLDDDA